MRAFLFAFVLLVAPVFAGGDDAASAGAVAVDFINSYIKASSRFQNGYESAISWMEKSPLVTPHFATALAKLYRDALRKDPEMGYDADAVLGGQDFADAYRFKSGKVTGSRARVILQGTGSGSEMTVKVDLVKSDDGWLVDGSGDLAR